MSSDAAESLLLADVAATHALAARLAERLGPGDVLALEGELGAGKTELVRGLARALGVPPEVPVTSPSFVLLHVLPQGRLPLAHFDAYFMDDVDDLERAGLHDLRREGCLVVIEWADRVAEALPEDCTRVVLEPADGLEARQAHVTWGRAVSTSDGVRDR